MTADELAERLLVLDGGQHLEVRLLTDMPADDGDDCADFEVKQGFYGGDKPQKVVLYIVAGRWEA